MKWRSLGQVFHTQQYAQTPTPLVLDDRIRVYFAQRSNDNRSFIRFVDLDINDPTKLLGEPSGRVLENGAPGAFDSCGQMPSCALGEGSHIQLFYSGWLAPAGDVPYHNATGYALSTDGGETFVRPPHPGPILDRTQDEPYLAVTPCVRGKRMWYITGLRWEKILGRYEPIYGISTAQWNGFNGTRGRGLVIPQAHRLECFSRPCVFLVDNVYHMTYSYRSAIDYRDGEGAYRIGLATSNDGVIWDRRDDEFQIERGDWDATMQCYFATFQAKGKLYGLYNGSSFGKFGFGLVVAS